MRLIPSLISRSSSPTISPRRRTPERYRSPTAPRLRLRTTPINPSTFTTHYLHGTSFATANCLLHDGELYNGSPACKLYTLTCQVGTNPTQNGALCPASQQRNEFFQEVFDGPSFTLPDIAGTNGLTYHQGVGFLEAIDGWGGGSCVFDSSSSIHNQLCPQNVLTNFSGPGAYRSGGPGQSPNSTFITVAPVPEDLTTLTVSPQLQPGNWINKQTAVVNFVSTPPAVASNNNFVAAPIQSLTYGISSTSNVPQPGSPIPGDITVPNTACPTPGSSNPPPATSLYACATNRQRLCRRQIPAALLCPGLCRHRRAEVHPDGGKLVDLLLHFPHQCGHRRSERCVRTDVVSRALYQRRGRQLLFDWSESHRQLQLHR